MATLQDLQRYVTAARASGKSNDVIKSELILRGWPTETIEPLLKPIIFPRVQKALGKTGKFFKLRYVFYLLLLWLALHQALAFWGRQWVTSIALATNIPGFCRFVPASDTCGSGPFQPLCRKPELCYIAVGAQNKNLHACDELATAHFDTSYANDWQKRYESIIQCYHQTTTNPSVQFPSCDNITDSTQYRGQCYGVFATLAGDNSICKKTSNSEVQGSCFITWLKASPNLTNISPSFCSSTIQGSYYRDECFDTIARAQGNSSLCNQIQNSNEAEKCTKIINKSSIALPTPNPKPTTVVK